MVKHKQKLQIKPTTRTSSTSRTIQFLIISISISKFIFFLITINLSLKISNLSLNPIFGQTLNEFYQIEFHQFIDLVLIPISLLLIKSLIKNQNQNQRQFISKFSIIYFFILSILIERLPLLYSFDFSSFSNRLVYKFKPLWITFFGYAPIRFLGILFGIFNLELDLNELKLFKNRNQNNSFRFIWISASSLIFHGLLRFSFESLSGLIFSNIETCEIFSISSITFLIFSILTNLFDLTSQSRTTTQNQKIIIKTILILLIYKIQPISQSLCKDEPTNHTKSKTNLIARRISNTGLITVGEFKDPESDEVFRYLRSDHSLLGGIWIGPSIKSIKNHFRNIDQNEIEQKAIESSESIYSTFIIQEAIRLVKRNQTEQQEEALIIGLGIGVSAKTLMKHSIKTTIVEIDPIVYRYALKYFGMIKPNGGIYLEDIRVYLNRNLKSENLIEKFDYVIHDVFTGGMVPADLFVKSFWIDLKKVLKTDGVLVINFAGLPTSKAGLMVLFTIFNVFPYCRTFSERNNQGQNLEELEFQNLVIFCKMNELPKFRKVTKSDVLNSSHKFWILNQLMNHELSKPILSILLKIQNQDELILKDEKDSIKLKNAQINSALNHWIVMRDLLDQNTWVNYY